MEIAKILVNQTTGHCMVRRRIPAGLVGGTVSVEFDDPIWDRLVKTVVFRGTEVKAAEFDGKTAVIPWEVLEHPGPYLFFGIWGSDPDSALQLPLIEVRIGPIEDATDPTADPGTDPTLPIWAQLKQDVEDLKKNGVGGESNVFIATYGETTVDELWAAAQEGKTCIVQQGNFYFLATSVAASRAVFSGAINGTLVTILCNSDGWSRTNITLEETISEKSTHLQHPTSKAVYDYVQEHGGDAAQADWNAAEGQPGHILNRPFYTEQQEVTILEETTLEANGSFGGFDGVAYLPKLLDLTDGQTCRVTYNGTAYLCKVMATTFQGLPCYTMGNAGAIGGEDTGEPFALAAFTKESAATAGIFGGIIPMDGSTSFTVSITGLVDVVHPIPSEYLENARGQKAIFLDLDKETASVPISEAAEMDASDLQNSMIVVYQGLEHSAAIMGKTALFLDDGSTFHNITFLFYHDNDTSIPEIRACSWTSNGIFIGEKRTLTVPQSGDVKNFAVYGKLPADQLASWRELSSIALSGVRLQSITPSSAKSLLLTMDDDGVLYYQIQAGIDLSDRVPVNKVTDEHINDLIDKKLDSGGNVAYDTAQNLTDAQKAQARENIGAQPVGSYLESTELTTAINTALAQAKESGEFDGEDGKDGVVAVTGATVGQTVKISAVDEKGVPTAWEPVDFLSGGGITDVQSPDGTTSYVDSEGIVKLPMANGSNVYGLVKAASSNYYCGVTIDANGKISLDFENMASGEEWLIARVRNPNYGIPFMAKLFDLMVKHAMCDIGTATGFRPAAPLIWTDAERIAALLRMGCTVDEDGFVKWTAQEVAE